MQHEQNWITLAETLGPRSHALKPLLAHFGTPEAIFAATEEEILSVLPGLGRGTLTALLRSSRAEEARRIAQWCHRNGVAILTYDSEDYPARLRAIDEPPAVLYCRGRLPQLDDRMVLAVVGPREADAYGEDVAYKLSFELAAAGVLIVSGMADGIDGVAAAAAISAGGETVAVLGSGIDIVYPAHHTRLASEILEHGAILTEYAPGTKPHGYNFPIRNRIISALSGAVLVPEADDRSGALITARYALLQGKELFAVPGDINNPRSAGTNRLLLNGASMALTAEDVLSSFRFLYHDSINEKALLESVQHSVLTKDVARRFGLHLAPRDDTPAPEAKKKRSFLKKSREVEKPATPVLREPDLSSLSPRQRELFALLPNTPFTVDVLTSAGVGVAEAAACLTVLEIYGLLASVPGGMYQKK